MQVFEAAKSPSLIFSHVERLVALASSHPEASKAGIARDTKPASSSRARRAALAAVECAAVDVCHRRFGLTAARALVDR